MRRTTSKRALDHRSSYTTAAISDDRSSSSGGKGSGRLQRGAADLEPGTLLGGGRYEVVEALGSGSNGTTYKCSDRQEGGSAVAVKVLSLRSLRDWKQLDLFEREARVLQTLDHPGIPRYLAWFEEDSESDMAFCLVQELAPGRSLEELVRGGWRADEAEVERVAAALLRTLRYLGSRRPPVVHRDIKPQNIVLEGGRAGGRLFLVDFGGVAAAGGEGGDPGAMGSTIVGTYGFMAPESFRGQASPESDLYGLGATLLFLLSGRPPSAFPLQRMRLDLSGVRMGPRLGALLEGLLEPAVEDRMTAEEALALLEGALPPPAAAAAARAVAGGGSGSAPLLPGLPRPPAGSRILVSQRGPRLEVDIPPSGLTGDTVASGAFALAWNAFVGFWTLGALAGGGVLFALFSLPFWVAGERPNWGVQLLRQTFGRQFIRERLEIGLRSWTLEQQLALVDRGRADWDEGRRASRQVGGRTDDVSSARVAVVAYVNGEPQTQLELLEGVNRHVLAEGLDPLEQEWLAQVINAHLQANRGRLHDVSAAAAAGRAMPEAQLGSSSGMPMNDYLGGSGDNGQQQQQQRQQQQQQQWEQDVEQEVQRVQAEGRDAGAAAAAAAAAAVERARRAGEAAVAQGRRPLGGQLWRGRERQAMQPDPWEEDEFDML